MEQHILTTHRAPECGMEQQISTTHRVPENGMEQQISTTHRVPECGMEQQISTKEPIELSSSKGITPNTVKVLVNEEEYPEKNLT